MNLKELVTGFVFDKESKSIGTVVGIDILKDALTILVDANETLVIKAENAKLLRHIGELDGETIVENDVITDSIGNLYEVTLEKGVTVYALNNKLERIGIQLVADSLDELEGLYGLVGNINQFEIQTVDFNVKIAKLTDDRGINYFYACNNKKKEEVDLIKVIYMGHQLLEEEEYERINVSHEEYLTMLDEGALEEVAPQELANYVLGMTYGKNHVKKYSPCDSCTCEEECEENENIYDERDDNLEEDSEFCSVCGEYEEDCNCDW